MTVSSSPPRYGSSSPVFNTKHSRAIDTPPSSPPTFEPAHKLITKPAFTNAFSVLGKRKALTATDGNARPAKRTAVPALKKSSSTTTQMHLMLGQEIEKRCKECGMVYVVCSEEDRKLHDVYHKQLTDGYEVGPQLASKASIQVDDDQQICVIGRDDLPWKRKHARNVLDIMTRSLGAVEILDEELWRPSGNAEGHFEMWMYLRGNICAAAMLIETPKHGARRVVDPVQLLEDVPGESAIQKLRRRREAAKENEDAPLRMSKSKHTAAVGISRIWTAPVYRGKGNAVALLNAMYKQHGQSSKLSDVAFSQPTTAGTRLARKWFGQRYGWMVY